ncbi:MAG: PEP-CTERM sorting domain-containing protein [Planctomycetota bacterium]|nr:PEP-CTERM sorting domain-containing protein [Planctomycetota bacterium]
MKFVCIAVLAAAGSVASAQLWNNGAVVNGSGLSVLDSGAGTLGAGHQISAGNTVAENFTAGVDWTVTGFSFFAYQTGATAFTFTSASWQIANSHGDALALTNSAVSNGGLVGYRVTETTLTSTLRPIFRVDVTGLNINLAAGSYVLRWSLAGTAASGPWAPPVPGSLGSGNARQSVANGPFIALTDSLTGTGMELPFLINGTAVPTPASLALLGLGGIAMGRRRR